ncbi:MAG: alanine--tRNA ligase [Bacteroidia bacterium]|nr:alanine--tRNA ligase [Bacteroidia bacterium]
MLSAIEIRKKFLDFFKSKNHTIVPSAPMVVKDDPTLMFINSGMAPFKDIFLGNSPIVHPRVANTQKCLRVSGKHNDLEDVGLDTYHHTMFEMLGNWSFGDYFKKEAIAWAWELLTEVYGIDKNRLYVTVFEGSAEEGLDWDSEAYEFWKEWLPEQRILKGSKKDNFWEMGETGPCGPCSEIHYDGRTDEERKKVPGEKLVNTGHPDVIEIWNLVFMQFERLADGSLRPLPKKHVDTGMGFERLVRVLQQKNSNYDTDVFIPIIEKIEDLSGLHYRPEDEHKPNQRIINVAIRVVADHIRTLCFSIADGQMPSHSGAGYVVRRILRRAVRYGYQSLNLKEPFLYRLVPVISRQMGDFFPELVKEKDTIEKVLKEEELSFYRTLENGLKRIDQICIEHNEKNIHVIDGKLVFELYDTYGFPTDLTSLIARSYGLSIDEKGFEASLEEQKNRSRKATKVSAGDWILISDEEVIENSFIGYEEYEASVKILRYRPAEIKNKKIYQIVLNQTPFYPEGGGQVGDSGVLIKDHLSIQISDTKKEHGIIVHITDQIPEKLDGIWHAKIDKEKRIKTTIHHSATHFLHAALRKVLGNHVEQKGSLVHPDYLRFDFSHFAKLTDEEIEKVEQLVNQEIRRAILSEIRIMPLEEAKAMGAMALFGEKYGEMVRVVTFDKSFSVELCGGCHVHNSAMMGAFKIVSESAVAAGIRRIEAVAGHAFDRYLNEKIRKEKEIKALLKNPKDELKAIEQLLKEIELLRKEKEEWLSVQKKNTKNRIIESLRTLNGLSFYEGYVDLNDGASIKSLLFELRNELRNTVVLLKQKDIDGTLYHLLITDDLVKVKNWDATLWIKEITGGKGGGQKFMATGKGHNFEGIEKIIIKS